MSWDDGDEFREAEARREAEAALRSKELLGVLVQWGGKWITPRAFKKLDATTITAEVDMRTGGYRWQIFKNKKRSASQWTPNDKLRHGGE